MKSPGLSLLLLFAVACGGGTISEGTGSGPDAPAPIPPPDTGRKERSPGASAAAGSPSADPPNACPSAPSSDSCTTPGQQCLYGSGAAGQRCTCKTGSGAFWSCESLACPLSPAPGAACSDPGLRCATGFENAGLVCIGPEDVWVSCPYNHFQGTFGGYNPAACPPDRPATGTPCCPARYPLGASRTCPYPGADGGTELDECRANHWARAVK